MGIKRRTSSAWTDAAVLKRYTGTGWVDVSTSRRYNGKEWVPLWRPTGTYTGTYEPVEYASYYTASSQRIDAGIPEINGMPAIIQGSGNGKESGNISTMVFFPADRIKEDLYDSQIISASLQIRCYRSVAPVAGTYLLLHYGGGLEGCPDTWDGTDSGDADSGTPRVYEDTVVSVQLNTAVTNGLRDGTVKFLAFNSSGLPDYMYYGLFDASYLRLNIQYKYT